jgi:hypothetical protein
MNYIMERCKDCYVAEDCEKNKQLGFFLKYDQKRNTCLWSKELGKNIIPQDKENANKRPMTKEEAMQQIAELNNLLASIEDSDVKETTTQ